MPSPSWTLNFCTLNTIPVCCLSSMVAAPDVRKPGEGRENLSGERFSLPSPSPPIPPFPKTFDFIESLLADFPLSVKAFFISRKSNMWWVGSIPTLLLFPISPGDESRAELVLSPPPCHKPIRKSLKRKGGGLEGEEILSSESISFPPPIFYRSACSVRSMMSFCRSGDMSQKYALYPATRTIRLR